MFSHSTYKVLLSDTHELLDKTEMLCLLPLQWGGKSCFLFPLLLTSLQTNFLPPIFLFFFSLVATLKKCVIHTNQMKPLNVIH